MKTQTRSLRSLVENHPVVWLLATLLAGFSAGFATYGTILKVAKLETVRADELRDLNKAKKNLKDLRDNVGEPEKLSKTPMNLTFTSGIRNDDPIDRLVQGRVGESITVHIRWLDLTPLRPYYQRLEIRDPDRQILDVVKQPFIQPGTAQLRVWALFTPDLAGTYEIIVFLNDTEQGREVLNVVEGEAGPA